MSERRSMDMAGASGLVMFSALLAFNQVVIKITNAGFSPVFAAGLRSVLGAVVLLAWVALRKRGALRGMWQSIGGGLLLGLLFSAEFVMLFQALDLTTVQLVEKAPTPQAKLVARLADGVVQQLLLRDACAAIRSAASDERVVGLVAQLGSAPGADASLAQCQELSDAVSEFRAKKPKAVTIAHADSLGGLHYLLASSFEKVYVQPGSLVELPSFSREQPFLKAFLARWGLRLEAIAREEYKSAAAAFTDDGVTPASMKGSRWLRACFEQAVAQIGAARGLSQVQVARLARRGMLSSDEAVRTKLLDGTLYQDEAEALAKKEAGTSSAAVTLERYHEARGASRQRRESDERTASYKARARIIATLPADAAGLAVHAVGAVFGAASTLDVATWPAPPQLLTSAGVQLRQLTNFGGGAAVERAAAEAAAAEGRAAEAVLAVEALARATEARATAERAEAGRADAAEGALQHATEEHARLVAAAAPADDSQPQRPCNILVCVAVVLVASCSRGRFLLHRHTGKGGRSGLARVRGVQAARVEPLFRWGSHAERVQHRIARRRTRVRRRPRIRGVSCCGERVEQRRAALRRRIRRL